jgi:hypothetical protein
MKNMLCNAGLLVSAVAGLLGLENQFGSFKPASSERQVTESLSVSPQAMQNYGKLPLSFEANAGQVAQPVKFTSRGAGYNLFLTPTEAVLTLQRPRTTRDKTKQRGNNPSYQLISNSPVEPGNEDLATTTPAVLRMKLLGANLEPRVSGENPLPGKSHYLIGDDPKQWRTNVAHYAKVKYQQTYPGIDLVYYGNQRQLEYDFIVAPHANPQQIRLGFSGAKTISLDARGRLILDTGHGKVVQKAPVVYQKIDGKRRLVAGKYRLINKNVVGFQIGSYDRKKPLVIDPILIYSTYLGGMETDAATGIATDAAGNVYLTGWTNSGNFPVKNPYQTHKSINSAFVTKLNASGSALVYSTYIGGGVAQAGTGGNSTMSNSIAVDSSGNAYIAGVTNSTDFPLHNAQQSAYGGGYRDAFVTKLNASGSALVYSSYLGGGSEETAYAIAVDSSGRAHIAGRTNSTNFPLQRALQSTLNKGANTVHLDAFISKYAVDGSSLEYSSYFGGHSAEEGNALALDASGNIYFTGRTGSHDLPITAGSFQTSFQGGNDAYVAKLDPSQSDTASLIYSTFLGGSSGNGSNGTGGDFGTGISVDASGNAVVVGDTTSTNFPTSNPVQSSKGGDDDAFITKINATGTSLLFSTWLGGTAFDAAYATSLDSDGNIYVTGTTNSSNFPSLAPIQALSGGSSDAFVAKFNAAGHSLSYSTYFGGSGSDQGKAIAVDGVGNAYIAGITASSDFPTKIPYQPINGGMTEAFVAKVALTVPAAVVTTTSDTIANDGVMSLREAINQANLYAGTTISFQIPTSDAGYQNGVFTIRPTSDLPVITGNNTIINGASQADFMGNTNVSGPEIMIDGNRSFSLTNGLTISAANCTVKGFVISRFVYSNLLITGNSADNNTIQGCFIGPDATGKIALANGGGIRIETSGNLIGGTLPGQGNLLSASNGDSILIAGANASRNTVQGNLIGTNIDGTAALVNGAGIQISHASDNLIGGTSVGARNVISGSRGFGILIQGSTASNNVVQGNYIGTDITGQKPLGNATQLNYRGGIDLDNGAHDNVIGGINPGAGNLIAYNKQFGIIVSDANTLRNSIRGNSIFSNESLGINLWGGAENSHLVTSNDSGDADTGPHNYQNFPLLTSAVVSDNTTVLNGTLNSRPNSTFNIDFYRSNSVDPSGYGEGQSYIGSTNVSTNVSGNATFSFSVANAYPDHFITAIAIDSGGNTSEFSRAVKVGSTNNVVTTTSDTVADDGVTSLREAIGYVNANPGVPIVFNIPNVDSGFSAGVFTIRPTSELPAITANETVIDGSTQTTSTGDTNSAGPEIVLSGPLAGNGRNGLTIAAANCTIKNLIINGFSRYGIELSGTVAQNNVVQACYLGTNSAGTAAVGNLVGISPSNGAKNNLIGGTSASQRNLISGNVLQGISIGYKSNGNKVQGNFIGTDITGLIPVGNGRSGVGIGDEGYANVIGGTSSGARNLISGNALWGVFIGNPNSDANFVQGNFIGTDVTGIKALANTQEGIRIGYGAKNNTIGGTTSSARNVISGNTGSGIVIIGSQSTRICSGNTIYGNYIGVGADGAVPIPNRASGIVVDHLAQNNLIGGTSFGQANIIANNDENGVSVTSDIYTYSTGNQIRGNRIFNNGKLGINLVGGNENTAGVSGNDVRDPDIGANDLQNYPVITLATTHTGTTFLTGTFNSTPNSNFILDFYSNTSGDVSGYGEGENYLGSQNLSTDANGNADFSYTASSNLSGRFCSVTATNLTTGNTSEFSRHRVVENGQLTLTINPSTLSESGGTGVATATLTRSTYTAAPLTVAIINSDSSRITVPASVTIPEFSNSVTFPVDAVDNSLAEGEQTVTVSAHKPGFASAQAAVKVTDDEVPSLTLSANPATFSEGAGATASTITVSRNTSTDADLQVQLSSSNSAAATVPDSVTIPSGQPSITFCVATVENSSVNAAKSVTITASATGFLAGTTTVTVQDNDTAAIAVTPTSGLTTSESGGKATFTVALTSQPTSEVHIGLSSSNTKEGTVTPTNLTFTADNWNTAQMVTVTGVGDQIVDGNRSYTIIIAPASSDDASYRGLDANDVNVTNTNVDVPILTLTSSQNLFVEGSTVNATVHRNTDATDDLVVHLSSSDLSAATVPAQVTIPANQSQVSFTITGIEDAVVDGIQSATISASHSGFIAGNLNVSVVDNDAAGIAVNPTQGLVTNESGSQATFSIVLSSQPTAEVTIPLSSSQPGEATLSSATIVFTPQNWNVARQVVVTGVDDNIADGDQPFTIVTSPAQSVDLDYKGLNAADIDGINCDNDVAALTLTLSATAVVEGSTLSGVVKHNNPTNVAFTVVLSSSNTDAVMLPASVVIPAGTDSVTFSITVPDDVVAQGTREASITATHGTLFSSQRLSIMDNQLPTLTLSVTPSSFSEAALPIGKAVATGTVSRNTPSDAAVTVNLNSSDNSEATVPFNVTIPAGSASVTFVIMPVDDKVADGNQTVQISAAATGFVGAQSTLTVTDDETPALTITVMPTRFAEGATGVKATLTRNSEITANTPALTVNLSSSDTSEVRVPAIVTIPARTASVTVAITVPTDTIADGLQRVTLKARATGFAEGTSTVTVLDTAAASNLMISGQLLSNSTPAFNKAPIPEATVVLRKGTLVVDEVTTDRLGNYSFKQLAAGSYTVTPLKTGFTFAPVAGSISLPRPNTIKGAPHALGVNFVGTPRTLIRGTLMRRLDNGVLMPVVGGSLIAYHRDGAIYARTDKNGNYLFDRVGYTPYQIMPLLSGTYFRPRVRIVSANATTPDVTGIDFLAEGSDSTAPQVTLVEPRASSFTLDARSTLKVAGTASDSGGGNVAAVTVALAKFSGSTDNTPDSFWYWKNNTFITLDSPVVVEAVAKGTTSWNLLEPTMVSDLHSLPAGFYGIRVTVSDGAGNITRSTWRKFRITGATTTRSFEEAEVDQVTPTSPVRLSTARVAGEQISLVFTGALDAESATDTSNFRVQVNGVAVDVESLNYARHTVVLSLAEKSLSVGDEVLVQWSHLRDEQGRLLRDSQTHLVAR